MAGAMAVVVEAVWEVVLVVVKVVSEAMAGWGLMAMPILEAVEEEATMAPGELLKITGAVLMGALAMKPMVDAVAMVMPPLEEEVAWGERAMAEVAAVEAALHLFQVERVVAAVEVPAVSMQLIIQVEMGPGKPVVKEERVPQLIPGSPILVVMEDT